MMKKIEKKKNIKKKKTAAGVDDNSDVLGFCTVERNSDC